MANKCLLCGSAHFRFLRESRKGSESVPVLKCQACGLVYSPQEVSKDKLTRFYAEKYRGIYSGTEVPTADINRWQEVNACRRIRFMEKFVHAGKLLDIGCASGIFMKKAKQAGFSAKGVEPDKKFSAYARKLGLDVTTGVFRSSDWKEKFEMVTVWHLVHMVPDPVGFLKDVRKVMRKGGILFLEMPNMNDIRRKLPWTDKDKLYDPSQFCYYSAGTAELLLEKAGFRLRRLEYVNVGMPLPFKPGKGTSIFKPVYSLLRKIPGSLLGAAGMGNWIILAVEAK